MTKRYRFEVDFESPSEWGVGVRQGFEPGGETTMGEIASAPRTIASSLEETPDEVAACVTYPPVMTKGHDQA